MALTATNRGSGSTNTGGQNTLTITPGSNSAAGSLLVLAVAYDNAGASGTDPITTAFATAGFAVLDSTGNDWNAKDRGINSPGSAANDGVVLRTFYCWAKFPLTTSDSLTVSFNAVTVVARAWTLTEVTCAAGKYVADLGVPIAAQGTSTTPSNTSSSATTGDIVFGCMGAQGNAAITADSDTTNGNWSTQQTSGVGVTTAGMEIASQNKVVTGTGTQTYNLTITSAVWSTFTRVFRETTLPTYLTRTPYGSLVQPQVRGAFW